MLPPVPFELPTKAERPPIQQALPIKLAQEECSPQFLCHQSYGAQPAPELAPVSLLMDRTKIGDLSKAETSTKPASDVPGLPSVSISLPEALVPESTRNASVPGSFTAQTADPTTLAEIPQAEMPDPATAIAQSSNQADQTPDSNALEQVTSVSQLLDVQPRDWAFQAVQTLVERYGCLQGYPNRSFLGNRSLSRYEFAAGLNACLEKISERLAASSSEFGNKEDLLTVQKLQEDFAAELASLRGRIDSLEARTTTLQQQQFSTTTVLGGQAIFALATAGGGNPPGRGETNTVFSNVVQLQLISSFTGRDLLRVGLATGSFGQEGFANERSLNTNMSLLSYQTDLNSQFRLSSLDYRFALGDRLVLTLQPVGFSLYSVLSPNTSYQDAGQGAVSRFTGVNPVFRIGNLDTGVGLDWLISDKWRFQFAYGARNTNDSSQGLFHSGHQAMGFQLLHKPSPTFILGFGYVNAYADDGRLDTFTGSNNADISGGFNRPAKIHALQASFRWRITPGVTLGGWGGAMLTDSTFGEVFKLISNRDLDLSKVGAVTLATTYLVSLGFDDPFGRKGDQLVFMVGQPPKLQAGVLIERVDDGNSFHFESFYRFRASDRISISPGFFYVTNPGHIKRNNDIFVGTIRVTFTF